MNDQDVVVPILLRQITQNPRKLRIASTCGLITTYDNFMADNQDKATNLAKNPEAKTKPEKNMDKLIKDSFKRGL